MAEKKHETGPSATQMRERAKAAIEGKAAAAGRDVPEAAKRATSRAVEERS
jgi:hypothetical protein